MSIPPFFEQTAIIPLVQASELINCTIKIFFSISIVSIGKNNTRAISSQHEF